MVAKTSFLYFFSLLRQPFLYDFIAIAKSPMVSFSRVFSHTPLMVNFFIGCFAKTAGKRLFCVDLLLMLVFHRRKRF